MNDSLIKEKVCKETISKLIIERITHALMDGDLKPGDKLPADTEIAELLGVGRNSVREAEKIMEAFGILEIRRAEGTFIAAEYHEGVLEPLLYGIILDSQMEEKMLQLKERYFLSVLFLSMDALGEEAIGELKGRLAGLGQVLGKKEGNACEIYSSILRLEEGLVELCGNPALGHLHTAIEKLCRHMRLQKIEEMTAKERETKLGNAYGTLLSLLEKKDRLGLVNFFEEKRKWA